MRFMTDDDFCNRNNYARQTEFACASGRHKILSLGFVNRKRLRDPEEDVWSSTLSAKVALGTKKIGIAYDAFPHVIFKPRRKKYLRMEGLQLAIETEAESLFSEYADRYIDLQIEFGPIGMNDFRAGARDPLHFVEVRKRKHPESPYSGWHGCGFLIENYETKIWEMDGAIRHRWGDVPPHVRGQIVCKLADLNSDWWLKKEYHMRLPVNWTGGKKIIVVDPDHHVRISIPKETGFIWMRSNSGVEALHDELRKYLDHHGPRSGFRVLEYKDFIEMSRLPEAFGNADLLSDVDLGEVILRPKYWRKSDMDREIDEPDQGKLFADDFSDIIPHPRFWNESDTEEQS